MEVKSVSDYYYKQLLNAPYLYVITEVDSIYLYVLARVPLLGACIRNRAGPMAHPAETWGDRMLSHMGTEPPGCSPSDLPTSHLFYQLLTRLAMCVGGSQAYKMIPCNPHPYS